MQDGEVTPRGGPGDTQGRVVGRHRGGDRKSSDERENWTKGERVWEWSRCLHDKKLYYIIVSRH